MPSDLNDMLIDIRRKTSKIKIEAKKFLTDYENLYREAHRVFLQEQIRVGGLEGLEEFRYLTQILKRNRDVVMSMDKASNNIRSTEQFSFIEEEEEPPKKKEPEVNPDMIERLDLQEENINA